MVLACQALCPKHVDIEVLFLTTSAIQGVAFAIPAVEASRSTCTGASMDVVVGFVSNYAIMPAQAIFGYFSSHNKNHGTSVNDQELRCHILL